MDLQLNTSKASELRSLRRSPLAQHWIAASMLVLMAGCGGGSDPATRSGSSNTSPASSNTSPAASLMASALPVSATMDGALAQPSSSGTWVKIAGEGETFSVSGTQTVRYGFGSTWVQQSFTGGSSCSNNVFGDPLVGVNKQCEVQAASPAGAALASATEVWTRVAAEWETFTLSSTQDVRFGIGTNWIVKSASGTVNCTASFFGIDPAYGKGKQCEVLGTTGPATDGWKRVAGEWETLTLSGTQNVRFGIGTNWVVKNASGSVNCTSAFFGNDPAYGQFKQCEVQTIAPPPPPPPPPEVWTRVSAEWDTLKLPRTLSVRFGAGASWILKSASGTVNCTAAFFGRDPAYGQFKQCEVLGSTEGVVVIPATPPTDSEPDVMPPPPPAPSYQTAFYVDAVAGADSNNGLSPATAWKSLAKVRATFGLFKGGHAVLFKAGQTFPGSLRIEGIGTSGAPIVVASYGSGAKPVLSGFTVLSGWVSKGNGLWESPCAACGSKVNIVSVNGALQPMGRFPKITAANGGYLTVSSHDGTTSVTDSTFAHTENWVGGEMVTRGTQWILDRSTIAGQSGGTFTLTGGRGMRDGFGYFVQNHPRTLAQAGRTVGEWYFDPARKVMQMYFGAASPTSYVVKASTVETVVNLSNLSFITLDNIAIEGAGTAAVNVSNSSAITVQNTDIALSGTDAIAGTTVADMRLEALKISDTGSNAVAVTFLTNAAIKNNRINNTGLVAGAGRSGDGTYIGISVGEARNTVISGNHVTNTGYNGISFTGEYVTIERNYVSDALRVKDDGGGIYTYQHSSQSHITNSKILNNIVLNSKGAPNGTVDPTDIPAHGIYLDGYLKSIEVTGNTVAGSTSSGLFVNHANNVNASGNTFYGNGSQILMSSYISPAERLRGAIVSRNIMVAKAGARPPLRLSSETANEFGLFGEFSSNYYVASDRMVTDSKAAGTAQTYDLPGWQAAFGKDVGSQKRTYSAFRFEYNASVAPKQVVLDGSYVDAKGAAQSGTVTLQPYTSLVLMR